MNPEAKQVSSPLLMSYLRNTFPFLSGSVTTSAFLERLIIKVIGLKANLSVWVKEGRPT